MPPTTNIDWKWWDAQTRTLESLDSGDYDLVVYRGGYGAGKTVLGVRWIIQTALSVPKSDNLIIAPDSKKGAPSTYKRFFEELPGQNTVPDEGGDPENSPIVSDYHGTKRRVTIAGTKAVIRLGSADKWNRYAGSEFNAVYCDEVAHYDNTDLYKLHRMLTTRQRTTGGPNVTLWTSTGNGFNQFYDITERRVNKEDENLPWAEYMKVVQADSRDNPFLQAREKYERTFGDTEQAEQALAGGFASPEGLVYNKFSRQIHVRQFDEIEFDVNWRIYGYDAGWDDPRVVLEIGRTPLDQFVVLDEFYESGSQPEDIVRTEETGDGWMTNRGDGPMYCEHEPAHIEKFRRAGWDARKAEKSLDEGIPCVQRFLKTDDGGRPGLIVAERCTQLIKEFLDYEEDDVGKKKATDHALDALRYALFSHEQFSSSTSTGLSGSMTDLIG